MKYALGIIVLLLPWLAIAEDRPPVPVPGAPAPDLIVVEKCTLEYERVTTVGAFVLIQASGRLQDIYVQQGTRVKAGQVMARLHDRDARAELSRLSHEVEDNIDIPLSEVKLAQNRLNLDRSRSLFKKDLYHRLNLEIEEMDARILEFEVSRAKHSHRADQLARARVEAEVRSREIVAPHDGIVVEVFKHLGESTLPNEAVYRMVDPDLLRVTGHLDVKDAWRAREGQLVRIGLDIAGVDMPIEREVFDGHVSFVDAQIDPETRTCKVVAEVKNRDGLLRSGLEAHMEIVVEPRTTPAEPPPSETKPAPDAKGPVRR